MKIFVGHDSRQPQNTKVCVKSIERFGHSVQLLDRAELQKLGYNRVEDGSTEFTYTRFLVPYLCNYRGRAMFCDSDFVWRKDPRELLSWVGSAPVSCVHHRVEYVRSGRKFLEHTNEWYPRKWWSSMMVFNCDHTDCSNLTIDTVNNNSPSWLHRFEWANEVGELDKTFNYLVGYYKGRVDPTAVHFTDGTPLYLKYKNEQFAEEFDDLRRI